MSRIVRLNENDLHRMVAEAIEGAMQSQREFSNDNAFPKVKSIAKKLGLVVKDYGENKSGAWWAKVVTNPQENIGVDALKNFIAQIKARKSFEAIINISNIEEYADNSNWYYNNDTSDFEKYIMKYHKDIYEKLQTEYQDFQNNSTNKLYCVTVSQSSRFSEQYMYK